MSNPPVSSENAAPDLPVSEGQAAAGGLGGGGGGSDGGKDVGLFYSHPPPSITSFPHAAPDASPAPGPGPGSFASGSAASTLSGGSVPVGGPVTDAFGSDAVDRQPGSSPTGASSTTSTHRHTSSPAPPPHPTAVSNVEQNKKPRSPPVGQRSNGPSLLTQALASARGILQSPVLLQRQSGGGGSSPSTVASAGGSRQNASPGVTWWSSVDGESGPGTTRAGTTTADEAADAKDEGGGRDENDADLDDDSDPDEHGGGSLTPRAPSSPTSAVMASPATFASSASASPFGETSTTASPTLLHHHRHLRDHDHNHNHHTYNLGNTNYRQQQQQLVGGHHRELLGNIDNDNQHPFNGNAGGTSASRDRDRDRDRDRERERRGRDERGTSLERTERERGAMKSPPGRHRQQASLSSSSSPAPLADQLRHLDLGRDDEAAAAAEQGSSTAAYHRAPRGPGPPHEHRLSLGPEKIWSIGAGTADYGFGAVGGSGAGGSTGGSSGGGGSGASAYDSSSNVRGAGSGAGGSISGGASHQQGPVEKSITEALAGGPGGGGDGLPVRSRKASHSLRFFREGLPTPPLPPPPSSEQDGASAGTTGNSAVGAAAGIKIRSRRDSSRLAMTSATAAKDMASRERERDREREGPTAALLLDKGGVFVDEPVRSSSLQPSPRSAAGGMSGQNQHAAQAKLSRVRSLTFVTPDHEKHVAPGEEPGRLAQGMLDLDGPLLGKTKGGEGYRVEGDRVDHIVTSPASTQEGESDKGQKQQLGRDHGPDDTADTRRKSGDSSTEVGEALADDDDDADGDDDDSGEEKISSAVFVPHQPDGDIAGIDDDEGPRGVGGATGGARTTPASRSMSRVDDFHPWLVKADEPEMDDTSGDNEEAANTTAARRRATETTGGGGGGGSLLGLPDGFVKDHHIDEHAIVEDDQQQPDGPLPNRLSRPVSEYYDDHVHEHQYLAPRQPLEAIELIPYKHQVGGHTTLWRFSRRAVCKQLNNRENEFYEKIEKYHRELLAFLPRYIGVLNVTYQKLPRRKSTVRKDEASLERLTLENGSAAKDSSNVNGGVGPNPSGRIISQSLGALAVPIPTVTFVDNQHILPRHLLQPSTSSTSLPGRFRSASSAGLTTITSPPGNDGDDEGDLHDDAHQSDGPVPTTSRPSLEERHANSWGATTVNKRLRNEVFNDAFLKQPISVQRHRKAHQRAIPRKPIGRILRPAQSDSGLLHQTASSSSALQDGAAAANGHDHARHSRRLPATSVSSPLRMTQSDLGPDAVDAVDTSTNTTPISPSTPIPTTTTTTTTTAATTTLPVAVGDFAKELPEDVADVTGTSAPEPKILAVAAEGDDDGSTLLPPQKKRQRRYSGSGLRRKPDDLNVTEGRGDLKYFQEADDAGYKGDNEGLPSPPPPPSAKEDAAGGARKTSVVRNGVAALIDRELAGAHNNNGHHHHNHSPYASTVTSGAASPATAATSATTAAEAEAEEAEAAAAESPSTALQHKIPRPVNPKEAQSTQTQRDRRVEYFLLLEDLTAGMKRPCIMDLKMGTRQYGVDATPKKQLSQQGKCAKTTSRRLGVRVCGLQVWDADQQAYVFKDKYYGRDLEAGREFQDALCRFLYDGVSYASVLRHIPTILAKLGQLEVIIRSLGGYRFYAASLLMFYDGDNSPGPANADGAAGGGGGFETSVDDSTTDFQTDNEEQREKAAQQQQQQQQHHHNHHHQQRRSRKNKREIDFKMADFANSVTRGDLAQGKPCPPQHPNDPDRGFLRGLATLRKYFLRIQRDVREKMNLEPARGRAGEVALDVDASDEDGEVSE